jgi:hypothetical protein
MWFFGYDFKNIFLHKHMQNHLPYCGPIRYMGHAFKHLILYMSESSHVKLSVFGEEEL